MTNKQFAILIAILLVAAVIIAVAQNPTLTPYQFSVNNVSHTSCTVVAATTQYCYASDGPYVSINGAAYVSMLPGGTAAITATSPLVVSGSVVSCPTCATTPVSIPFSQVTGQIAPSQVPALTTTVTSNATTIVQ